MLHLVDSDPPIQIQLLDKRGYGSSVAYYDKSGKEVRRESETTSAFEIPDAVRQAALRVAPGGILQCDWEGREIDFSGFPVDIDREEEFHYPHEVFLLPRSTSQ